MPNLSRRNLDARFHSSLQKNGRNVGLHNHTADNTINSGNDTHRTAIRLTYKNDSSRTKLPGRLFLNMDSNDTLENRRNTTKLF